MLGTAERERAYSTVHEGAVYLHLGEQYGVTALDLDARAALVRPVAVDWYTQAQEGDDDGDRRVAAFAPRSRGVELHHGRIAVTEQVVAFQRKAIADGSVIDTTPLELPETTFETEGVWFCPTRPPARRDRRDADARLRAPRRRALAHLAPAALCDVRPLGHRRSLDERPRADRAADDLRLRGPRRRRRHHRARLRLLRRLGRRTRRGCSSGARARPGAPPASRARSAATSTRCLDKAAARTLLERMVGSEG